MNLLNGYKTYISAGMVVIAGLLYWAGIINAEALTSLVVIFGGATGLAMRSAMPTYVPNSELDLEAEEKIEG